MTRPRRLVVDLAATSRNWALPPEGIARIRAATPTGWEVVIATSATSSDGDGGRTASPEVLETIRDAEVYFGFGITRDAFAAAPALRWIHSASAGVRSILFQEVKERDILLTNSAGIMGPPIADQVLAGILHFTRGLDIALDQQRRAEWNKAPFVNEGSPIRELAESEALIVGTGGIGSAVAVRLAAFGCRCVGVRRRPELGAPNGFERVIGLEQIDEALPGADILVLATPQTPLTEGLLTAARMDCLPRTAIVVNVARGALLDEGALTARLEAGRLRGAVLDVFQHEPLPPSSALWRLRNVLITPHVSAVSPRIFWQRELELFLDNWARYRDGRPLRNHVDKEAGY
jgi:phosphoglycerate dehydrogenase-like enzyme